MARTVQNTMTATHAAARHVDSESHERRRWPGVPSAAVSPELAEQLDLAMEVSSGIEVLIHAGEPEVGHLVDNAEQVEHDDADLGACGFRTAESHGVLDRVGDLLDPLGGDAAALGGGEQAVDDLGLVEWLDGAVRLHDGQRGLVNAFERGEAV